MPAKSWVFFVLLLSIPAAREIKAAQNALPAIGAAAVEFELKTLDGQSVRLETYRGKPLIVNFFASWCDPCRDEMPLLNEIAAKSSSARYALLGVAVQDSRAALTEFAKEARIAFPIALDLNSKVQRAYGVFGPPATFVIDDQGIVRDIVLGPITPERAREAMAKAGIIVEVKK
jgi:cytochrome c biogenesis protein CcmG/thiol:disulfide interchange protein DsbE